MLLDVAVGLFPICRNAGCPLVATRIWYVCEPKLAVACEAADMVIVVFVPARELGVLSQTSPIRLGPF